MSFSIRLSLILIALFIATQIAQCGDISLPVMNIPPKSFKTTSVIELTEPQLSFENEDSGQLKQFPHCKTSLPDINFHTIDQIVIKQLKQIPPIVYDFEDIKTQQDILDVYIFKGKYFIMTSNGKLLVLQTKTAKNHDGVEELKFDFERVIEVPHQQLEPGYFFQVSSELFFNNGVHLYYINTNPLSYHVYRLLNYNPLPNFETVISLKNKFIAIGYEDKGVVIYQLTHSNQSQQPWISKQYKTINLSQKMNLADIAYNPKNDMLYVLDELEGVFEIKLTYQENGGLTLGTPIKLLKTQSICDLIALYNQKIYLSCQTGIIKMVKNQDKNVVSVLAHPQIKVKQIFIHAQPQTQNSPKIEQRVFLIGSNSFKVIYLDQITTYYQNHLLVKLFIFDNIFISVNNHIAEIGVYKILPSYIRCQVPSTEGKLWVGHLNARVVTVAECLKLYMANLGMANQVYDPMNDRCIYTVDFEINIWQAGQINWSIAFYVVLGLIILSIVMTAFYVFFNLQLKSKRQQYAVLMNQTQNKN